MMNTDFNSGSSYKSVNFFRNQSHYDDVRDNKIENPVWHDQQIAVQAAFPTEVSRLLFTLNAKFRDML